MNKLYFILLGSIFSVLLAAIYFWCIQHPEYDLPVLLIANSLLCLLSVLSFYMLKSKLKNGRPQAFVNGVYGATLLRLMTCMAGICLYLFINRGHLHQASVFAMMGLYIVYTAYETIALSKVAKK